MTFDNRPSRKYKIKMAGRPPPPAHAHDAYVNAHVMHVDVLADPSVMQFIEEELTRMQLQRRAWSSE
jgi:hypothetical protein